MFVCKTMHDSVKWVYFYGVHVFTAECGLTEKSFTKVALNLITHIPWFQCSHTGWWEKNDKQPDRWLYP